MPVTPDCESDKDCPGIGERCVNPGAHNANCELVSYYGQCRDEAGSSRVLGRSDIVNWSDCREKCRIHGECVAFSYESHNSARYNCYRFKGGLVAEIASIRFLVAVAAPNLQYPLKCRGQRAGAWHSSGHRFVAFGLLQSAIWQNSLHWPCSAA